MSIFGGGALGTFIDPTTAQTLTNKRITPRVVTLTDAATGQPVTDLQPYLGAFGHTLIVSEDLQDAVHSHPSPGPESDVSRGLGGPHAIFEGYLPTPGVYRAWTQFFRNNRLSTFTFTFRVWSLDEAVRLKGE